MHEINRIVLVPLPTLFGIDFSITNEVALVWCGAALTFVLLMLACRRRGLTPRGGFQTAFEAVMDFVRAEAVDGCIGPEGRTWTSFLLTLFFFVLFCNLIGFIPIPAIFKPATSNINVTGALALAVFAVTLGINIRRRGVVGFARRFLPGGVPLWLAPVWSPSRSSRGWAPVSLALRLFANMMAGHLLIFTFIGMAMTSFWLLKPLPLAGAVLMGCFELFVSFIQAFIFTMLAAIYINDALGIAALRRGRPR